MQFNYSLLTGISAVLFSLAITDPVLVFRLLIEVCWACVKSGIQATPRGLCRYTWCLGAKNEKISLIIFVPSSVVAGSGCFHCPEIYSFLRKRSLVLVMNKGVAELVSLKLWAYSNSPSLWLRVSWGWTSPPCLASTLMRAGPGFDSLLWAVCKL